MNFLDRFSLEDVAIVFIGLVIVSIVRIWYDSHVNKKKATQFGNSLGIYNSLLDDVKEGLLIVSNNNKIIYSNMEAIDLLNTTEQRLDIDYLTNIDIENTDTNSKDNLLNIIQTQTHIPNASLKYDDDNMKSISISINKIKPYKHTEDVWYVNVLKDMTQINELRDGARNLLDG